MRPEVVAVDAVRFLALSGDVLRIYADAFAAPPYLYAASDVAGFDVTLRQHARRAGFKACMAFEGANAIGFAYGYTGAPGQWWHDFVAAGMPAEASARWLSDSFELVELAVEPASHGLGAGSRLHDLLLEGLPQRTAVLSTAQEETIAQRLYRTRGWQVLVDGFIFPNRPHPYRIMGIELR